jgi:hypothetical protein
VSKGRRFCPALRPASPSRRIRDGYFSEGEHNAAT